MKNMNKPLLSRLFVHNMELTNENKISAESDRFTIATYNILADCHAQRDYNKPNSWISEKELSLESRHIILMEELKWLNADIICLQEVDSSYFENILKPSLKEIGYDGLYLARLSNEYEEGEATFYRFSKYKLKFSKGLLLKDAIEEEINNLKSKSCKKLKKALLDSIDSYAVSLLTRLENKENGNIISVANVHIAYDKFKRQDKQCLQIAMTLRELQKMCKDGDGQIICGDFNSWPSSPPHQLMNDGNINEENANMLLNILSVDVGDATKPTPLLCHVPELFHFNSAPNYKSAYEAILGSNPYTSRFNMDGKVRQVDFIYFSSTLNVQKVLNVPDQSFIVGGVPNSHFPSDHLSLMAEFSFV